MAAIIYVMCHILKIIIGALDNTMIAIRERVGGSVVSFISLISVLRCNSFSGFWISWKNGILSVGTGTVVGKTSLVHWQPSSSSTLNIKAISFASDAGQILHWHIHKQHGKNKRTSGFVSISI